ncbi:hypothetical protein BN903_3 [Halorubrum sp. AJ67]|nr:hypothetical protein BN903_3 [Halorubrum sp. AJ67]
MTAEYLVAITGCTYRPGHGLNSTVPCGMGRLIDDSRLRQ